MFRNNFKGRFIYNKNKPIKQPIKKEKEEEKKKYNPLERTKNK